MLLAIFSISRFAVYNGHRSRFSHASRRQIREAFKRGLRVDLIVAGYFIVPVWLLLCPVPEEWFHHPLHTGLVLSWLGIIFTVTVFGSIAEYFYFEEYGAKFNQVAIEYMRPGKGEISGMIWHDYPVIKAVLGVGVAVIALLAFVSSLMVLAIAGTDRWWELLTQTVLGALWIFAGCRGLKHRPIGINYVEFTNSKLVNQLAANGYYQLIRIWYDEWHSGGKVGDLFRKIDPATARETVRTRVASPHTTFVEDDAQNPLDRIDTSPAPAARPNVIMVLMESHAAAHIGCLGSDRGVSPYFDQLAQEGLLFTRMYASGDRTARGIESVLCSIPPLPGLSVIKRARSHGQLFTAASLFHDRGYKTKFYYGGDASFDNMSGFMLSNGFQEVFEQKDVKDPVWTTNWGHSDENLYDEILKDLSARKPDDPMFGFFLTISNHRPYTWPPGKIEPLYPGHEVKGTFQYADYAMGRFIEKARLLPQWNNTVFVFVADHGSAVHGRSLVPIERFHIPLLILGPGLEGFQPGTIDTIASQIDVLPTLMNLLGGSTRHMGFGRNLRSVDPADGSALMHYYGSYAYVREGKVVMMRPKQKPKLFAYDPAPAGGGVGAPLDEDSRSLADEGLAYLALAEEIYMNGRYTY